MRKGFFLFWGFFLIPNYFVFAQQKTIDSLRNALSAQKEDTNKVNTLNALSKQFISLGDHKAALQEASNALSLAEKLGFKSGMAAAFENMGDVAYAQLSFSQARKHFLAALQHYQQAGNTKKTGLLYLAVTSTYNEENNSAKALENIYRAVHLFEESGDKEGLAYAHLMLGSNNVHQKNYAEATKYLSLALTLFKGLGDSLSIAVVNQFLGRIYDDQGKYEEALLSYTAGLQIHDKFKDEWNAASALNNIGSVYEKQGSHARATGDEREAIRKFNDALAMQHAALRRYKEAKVPQRLIAHTQADIGNILVKMREFNHAIQYFDTSLAFFSKSKAYDGLEKVHFGLAALDSARRQFLPAYEHYKLAVLFRDSSYREEKAKQLEQVKMQYDFDKKEAAALALEVQRTEEDKRTKTALFSVIGGMLLVAVFLFVSNRQKQIAKRKIEMAYTQLKTSQQQLIQKEKMASLGELTAGIAHEIQKRSKKWGI